MLRRLALAALTLFSLPLLASCYGDVPAPDRVAFIGRLVDGTALDAGGEQVIPGAGVFVADPAGNLLTDGLTDATGDFTVGGLAKNVPVDLLFSEPAAQYGRAVFPGETQDRDSLLFLGSVFMYTSSALASVVSQYTTALGSTSQLMTFDFATNGAGAMVRGRVVTVHETGPGSFFYLNEPGARVSIQDGAGKSYRVFYRGNYPPGGSEGPIDPTRTTTGEDARFVAFGVKAVGTNLQMGFPVGPLQVTVTTTDGAYTYSQQTLAADNGLTVLDLFTVVDTRVSAAFQRLRLR